MKNQNWSALEIHQRKDYYMLSFDCFFFNDDHNPRVWCDILNFEVDKKVYINNIYDCMLMKMNDIKNKAWRYSNR